MPLERAIARAIIGRLIPEGLGSNAIIRYVQSQGYGYRRGDMLNDINEIGGFYEHERQFSLLAPSSVVPDSYMTEMDLNRPRNYRIVGEATYYDEARDDYVTSIKSFYTDDIDTLDSLEQQFLEEAPRSGTDPLLEYQGFTIKQVQHNEGLPY